MDKKETTKMAFGGIDPVYGAPKWAKFIFYLWWVPLNLLIMLCGLVYRGIKNFRRYLTQLYYQSKLYQWYGDPDMVRRYNFLRKKNGSRKTNT